MNAYADLDCISTIALKNAAVAGGLTRIRKCENRKTDIAVNLFKRAMNIEGAGE